MFASNLLEHLARPPSSSARSREVRRVLRPDGRFVLMQPNFRYCVREYFDDYTHRTVFTHVSLADLLRAHGFEIERSGAALPAALLQEPPAGVAVAGGALPAPAVATASPSRCS